MEKYFSWRWISFSNSFDTEFKRLIGRWFFLTALSIDLNIWVMSANFNSFCKILSAMHECSIFVKVGAQISMFSFSNLILTPVVDLFWYILRISIDTSSSVIDLKLKVAETAFLLMAIMLRWFLKRCIMFSKGLPIEL